MRSYEKRDLRKILYAEGPYVRSSQNLVERSLQGPKESKQNVTA
jgi:hypothetical protein